MASAPTIVANDRQCSEKLATLLLLKVDQSLWTFVKKRTTVTLPAYVSLPIFYGPRSLKFVKNLNGITGMHKNYFTDTRVNLRNVNPIPHRPPAKIYLTEIAFDLYN
jgi:hypothetical protein